VLALAYFAPHRSKSIASKRLRRRSLEIDKLSPKVKRQLTELLDAFIEGEKLKRRVSSSHAG